MVRSMNHPKRRVTGTWEPVLPLELLFQDGQLDQNDEQVKEDGELPQGQGCIQTEHIRDGGDGEVPKSAVVMTLGSQGS